MPLGAVISMTARSSSTIAAASGGSAADSSTATATASPSSTCTGSGSALEGWGRGSEGTTCAPNAKRFKGARLRTSVSAYLQEDKTRLVTKNQFSD
jgi:hypothetical protein